MLAAYNCRGIYSAELTFHVYYRDLVKTAVMTVGIDSPDFLKIYSAAEFANERVLIQTEWSRLLLSV